MSLSVSDIRLIAEALYRDGTAVYLAQHTTSLKGGESGARPLRGGECHARPHLRARVSLATAQSQA